MTGKSNKKVFKLKFKRNTLLKLTIGLALSASILVILGGLSILQNIARDMVFSEHGFYLDYESFVDKFLSNLTKGVSFYIAIIILMSGTVLSFKKLNSFDKDNNKVK